MKLSFRKDDSDVLSDIKQGNHRAMEGVYNRFRNEFVNWSIGKFNITEEDALDHYQDTLTVFFEQVMNGTISNLDSSLKTYLFGIGKNKIRQQFDEKWKRERHEESITEHYTFLLEGDNLSSIYEEAKIHTRQALAAIGDNCKKILRLFYFEKKSMSEIAGIWDIKVKVYHEQQKSDVWRRSER